ncbi:MAG: hypothetical protein M1835_003302 [Candelina submexicana]|nr:MAG: hypothetical protein M1835_003302 [Candelina submexicana]
MTKPRGALDSMKPILVEDEPASRFVYFNHVDNSSIAIDLEKDDDDEQGFKQGDYFSDEDINQLFLKHSEDFLLQSSSEVQASTIMKQSLVKAVTQVSTADVKSAPLSSFQSNEYIIKAGKSTIELNDGDFFYIKEIHRNLAKLTSSQSHYLPGLSTSTAEIHPKTSKVMSSLSSHRRSSTTASASQQRYVFGDAFCGAGGASRGAPS